MSAIITEVLHTSVKRIKFAWATAAASGGGTTGTTTKPFDGQILGARFHPDASTAPSASYDLTVTDEDGFDVLLGAGASLANSADVYVKAASMAAVAAQKLTLNVTNAGSSNAGAVTLFIR